MLHTDDFEYSLTYLSPTVTTPLLIKKCFLALYLSDIWFVRAWILSCEHTALPTYIPPYHKKVEALFDKMMMVCLLKMVFFMRTRRPLKWWNRWNSSKLFLPFCHQSCLVWNILMYSTITLKMGLSKQFILIWLFINWVS